MQSIKNAVSALFSTQSRMSWRRITVLFVGTGMLMVDRIDAAAWTTIALAYIAGDSAEKALAAFRK